MTNHFGKKLPDKIKRKWHGLTDTYKKAKDNNSTTGRAPTRFRYYQEMDKLVGGSHDTTFPVTATSEGISINRPDLVC